MLRLLEWHCGCHRRNSYWLTIDLYYGRAAAADMIDNCGDSVAGLGFVDLGAATLGALAYLAYFAWPSPLVFFRLPCSGLLLLPNSAGHLSRAPESLSFSFSLSQSPSIFQRRMPADREY